MDRPKLRTLERLELDRDDEPLLVLRDPLGISEPVAVPRELSVVLDLMTGQRTLAQIRQSLVMTRALDIDAEDLRNLVEDLSTAGMLEDERFDTRFAAELEDFMAQEAHPPRMLGRSYPDGEALDGLLAGLFGSAERRFAPQSPVRGIVTPHQPLAASAALLGRTLVGLPPPDELDLVILLGTDFSPGLTPYVVTDRPRRTPLGTHSVAGALIVELDRRLDWVLREEIRHRDAPALELVTLLFMAIYGAAAPPVLSVLCGQTALTTREGRGMADDFLGTMEVLCAEKRTLVWASAELSHRGLAYGELATPGADELRDADLAVLEPLLSGRAEAFVSRAMEVPGPPSGTAAIATLARLMPAGARGQLRAYESLAAPGTLPGLVGAAGLVFVAE